MSTKQNRSLRPVIVIAITIVVGTFLTVLLAQGLHQLGTGLAYYEELRAVGIDPQGPEGQEDHPELRSAAARRGTLFSLLAVLGTTVPLTALIATAVFFRSRPEVPIWRLFVVSVGLTALGSAAIALALPRIGSFDLLPGFTGGIVFWVLLSGFTVGSTIRRRKQDGLRDSHR